MRSYLFSLFVCTCVLLSAQTPITNAYFPIIGNHLITAKATNLSAYSAPVLAAAKGNLTWDFRNLRPQVLDTQRFVAPDAEGLRLFPDATMTYKPDSNAQTPFYRRTDSTFELIGLKGFLFQGIFIKVVVHPHSTLKERHAPLRFGDTYAQSAGFKVTFPPSVAPDSLLLNSPFAIPDSVRITYETVREDTIDSWGIVRLPNGDFPVLRERQKESITTKIEILYATLFGWLDVTTVVLSGLTQPFYSERFYFNYWHATIREPIAVVETDTQYAVRGIQYKAIAQRVDVPNVIDFSDKLTIFPNPTTAHLTINCDKINTPIHSILIMDYSGHLILNKLMNEGKSLELAVNNWQNSAYLICLLDKEGRILGKQRFVKN